jgi:rhamnulokinase
MRPGEDRKAVVAVDLGAQSCRVSILRWNHGEPEITVVHRFANEPISTNEGLRWDLDAICEGVHAGLRACSPLAPDGIASVGVDGWGVDYVRLNVDGHPAAQPFCYRDERTERAEREVHKLLPAAQLYELTGIQILRINTLYQLYADKLAGCDPGLSWVSLPEYIAYRLSGKRVSEYTNATHTGLVDLKTKSWSKTIFEKLGMNMKSAPEIVPSGTILGPVIGELAGLPAFQNTVVIVPACHDTASAIAAIPASGDDWAFISSGTWSLVGTVLDAPCVTGQAQSLNFTNLGGAGGKICFLKNVNGMWLLQQLIQEAEKLGSRLSLPELISRCSTMPAPEALIDVDDSQLMLPGHMLEKINIQLEKSSHTALAMHADAIPVFANLIFHSMAARYAQVLSSIGQITGKKLKRLFIVGGGSKNALLNQLTASHTGLEIILGSTESTTIGNFAIQLAALENSADRSGDGVTSAAVARWAEHLSSGALASATHQTIH